MTPEERQAQRDREDSEDIARRARAMDETAEQQRWARGFAERELAVHERIAVALETLARIAENDDIRRNG